MSCGLHELHELQSYRVTELELQSCRVTELQSLVRGRRGVIRYFPTDLFLLASASAAFGLAACRSW